MRKLEEAANELIGNNNKYIKDEAIKGFIKGVKFANEWISLDKEKPEDNKHLINDKLSKIDPKQTIKILVKTNEGAITDNFRLKMQVGEEEWVWFMNYDGEYVTHWRLIDF